MRKSEVALDHKDLALSVAREAGELIKNYVGGQFQVEEKSSVFDLVTEVDRESELLIRKRINEYNPAHKIIGEEGVDQEDISILLESDDYIWVIDPIDGTTNFVHGLPGYSVSIALVHKKEVILGVVYDPSLDEMFSAEKGKGAFLNGESIHISNIHLLEHSVLSTGFPSDIEGARANVIKGIDEIAPVCSNLRSFGSAALHLAYVATGRLEGFWEYNLNAWDIAAGYLLVKEAGGKVSDLSGSPYHLTTRNILATNGQVHEQLLGRL
ncbi:inositol monophosphatase [Alkalihalobacillus sp. MEB130]|uniref:inositol monophosphatase family protein n=1 Tax=Alkalihalobacillus sp. MEB130 TaxID=2976704 RepID=UPI0028DDC0F6|nr:inositol monophosphatase family protein [Alkalihalobacillus sp. MEB130]MDT8858940.1 inositol monophosphatase [Alkalihalobacillus sp. MEB130]